VVAEGLSSQGRTILWAVGGNGTIVYSPANWADKELVLVSAASGTAATIPVGAQAFRGPRFSPDGRRIAVDAEPGGDLVGDVWIFDRGSSAFTRLTLEGTSVFPEWTPRGDGIIYSSGGTNMRRSLFRVPADRSGPPVLLKTGAAPIFEGVLTPDEKTLLYRENSDSTGRDIHMLSGGKSTPFAAGLFDERTATISKDGRWVLYVSNESSRDEVYLRPLDGQGRVQVSASGGTEPRWGSGGKLAYYRWQDTLFSVPILPGPAVGARRVVMIVPYTPEAYHTNYDVLPDGSAFVFVKGTRQDATSDLTVVLNWFATLHRAGPP
jgi:Tol biopolymer transport system component